MSAVPLVFCAMLFLKQAYRVARVFKGAAFCSVAAIVVSAPILMLLDHSTGTPGLEMLLGNEEACLAGTLVLVWLPTSCQADSGPASEIIDTIGMIIAISLGICGMRPSCIFWGVYCCFLALMAGYVTHHDRTLTSTWGLPLCAAVAATASWTRPDFELWLSFIAAAFFGIVVWLAIREDQRHEPARRLKDWWSLPRYSSS